MARATVTVNGVTSRPATTPVRGAAVSNSLVDKTFGRLMLVRKISGKGTERGAIEKVAFVSKDNDSMIVVPTRTGEPMVFVGRKNADKHYRFVRFLRPSEKIEIVGSDA